MIQFDDYVRNAQTIIVTIAILVWGWMHFFHDRVFADKDFPRAEISHDIFSACLDSEHRLIRMKVEVRNVGAVQLTLTENNHALAQVSPPPEGNRLGDTDRDTGPTGSEPGLIVWPESLRSPTNSTEVILQPDETHEQYHDFVIKPSTRVIELTSTFRDTSPNKDGEVVNWEGDMKSIYKTGNAACPLVASQQNF